MVDRRVQNLRAALAFLRLPPTEPVLKLLHRLLDTWTGVGLITGGIEGQGYCPRSRTSPKREWRASFVG